MRKRTGLPVAELGGPSTVLRLFEVRGKRKRVGEMNNVYFAVDGCKQPVFIAAEGLTVESLLGMWKAAW